MQKAVSKYLGAEGALIKIEALANAAQYLTANDDERSLGLEILEVIEILAANAQKEINHVA